MLIFRPVTVDDLEVGVLAVELTEAGIAELRSEIIEHSIPNKKSWWGYDVIQIDDPDGNELLFPLESA